MIFRIAICDDEPEQAEALKSIVSEWEEKNQNSCRTELFPSAEAFRFACGDDSVYDILLLDVEMKGMSGIDLARRLRAEGSRAEIVFITSHFEFVGEGYEVDALHYLMKPVAKEKLFAVLSRAAERLAVEPPSVIFSCEDGTAKLYESDILYVEAFQHYIVIHTRKKEYRIKENISSFEQKLGGDFFRTHRSYLVNLKTIIRITRTSVTLDTGAEVPVARGKYDNINRAFISANNEPSGCARTSIWRCCVPVARV